MWLAPGPILPRPVLREREGVRVGAIADFGLRIADCGLNTADHVAPSSNPQSETAFHNPEDPHPTLSRRTGRGKLPRSCDCPASEGCTRGQCLHGPARPA